MRQGKTRTCEGRRNIQHRHTYAGRQWGDKTSGRRTHSNTGIHVPQWETRGDKGRQDLGKADTPSNTGTHVGRQWETRGDKGRQDPREGGHTIQHQGGHLKKALKTRNSPLFGQKWPQQHKEKRSQFRMGSNCLSTFRPEEDGTANLADANADVFGNQWVGPSEGIVFSRDFCAVPSFWVPAVL